MYAMIFKWRGSTVFVLAAILAAVDVFAALSRPAPQELQNELTRILKQPEYQTSGSLWLKLWLWQWAQRLKEFWNTYLSGRFAQLAEQAPVFYWLLVAATVALAVLLLYHIYITLRSAFGPIKSAIRHPAKAEYTQSALFPEALLAQADAAAQTGNFSEALRQLYKALLYHLNRQRLVRFDHSLTNQEYLRQIRPYPALYNSFHTLTSLAERIVYGCYPCNTSDWEEGRRLAQQIWQEAQNAAPL